MQAILPITHHIMTIMNLSASIKWHGLLNPSNCQLKFIVHTIYLYVLGPPSNILFFLLVLISCMVTLRSCLTWQIICFILLPNEYGCVYAWTRLGNIMTDRITKDSDFGKKKSSFHMKHLFIWIPKRVTVWCAFWSRGIIFFENE